MTSAKSNINGLTTRHLREKWGVSRLKAYDPEKHRGVYEKREFLERAPGASPFYKDAWTFGDYEVLLAGVPGTTLIQTTSQSHAASRVRKAIDEPVLKLFLECGNRFEVWGWKKVKNRWEMARRYVVLDETGTPVQIKHGKL